MTKFLSLLFLLCVTQQLSAQEEPSYNKEFRISTGIGLANATENVRSTGPGFWFQFDYKIAKHFSIAMEFEQMNYKTKRTFFRSSYRSK